jgi:hypothetical protein
MLVAFVTNEIQHPPPLFFLYFKRGLLCPRTSEVFFPIPLLVTSEHLFSRKKKVINDELGRLWKKTDCICLEKLQQSPIVTANCQSPG